MLLKLIALDDELETIRFLNFLSDFEESEKLSLSDLPDFPDEESLSLLLLLESEELAYLRLHFFDGCFILELLPNF